VAKVFDVLIVGGGLSGIGAACHLRRKCPNKSIAILEGRASIGGTWDLFRYPGIRSDSDMFTLGYDFKPWVAGGDIADGPSILSYIREAADEYKLTDSIQLNSPVSTAEWSSAQSSWTLTVGPNGQTRHVQGKMLLLCAGYYDYASGHSPEFQGRADFSGTIIHPQHWPENFDYADKRIVVIGSGATAVTLIPALAQKAQHVVMLQRSPSYIAALPSKSSITVWARRLLPQSLAYQLLRWFYIRRSVWLYRVMRRFPDFFANHLIKEVARRINDGSKVDPHFRPRYKPWDQRLCLVPDGDMFDAMNRGKASVVTDTIVRFEHDGIRTTSGQLIKADVIVTATGLNLKPVGGVRVVIDGNPKKISESLTYKGFMADGIPNFATIFGYVNASWTLRADLLADYFCRLINEMDRRKASRVTPVPRPEDRDMVLRPFIEELSSGYVQRSLDLLPKQGSRYPWCFEQNYDREKSVFRSDHFDDGVLAFAD